MTKAKDYNFSISKYNKWTAEILSDAPILVDKVMLACKVSKPQALELISENLKYLDLVSFTNQRLTPSVLVDYAWHEFILCTSLYAQFCNHKFGRFIHHHPGVRDPNTKNKFKKTVKYYILYIGKPDELYWGNYAKDEWEQSQCGNCLSK